MLSYIHSLMWQILDLIFIIYETLRWLCLRLHAATLWSYDFCCSRNLIAQRDYVFLKQCKTHLNKIPQHLNIIIGPESEDVTDETLSKIFTYSLYMDINCVSLYDTRPSNNCGATIEKMRTPKGVRCKKLNDRHFLWSVPSLSSNSINGIKKLSSNGSKSDTTNGYIDKPVEIYEITKNDGRPLIAKVCCELFQQRHTTEIQQLLKVQNDLTERINNELSKRLYNLPDPELSIIFNDDMCTFGLLPWQTRFTEFHKHETARYFDSRAFARILYKYSRCEQRWGK